MQINPGPASESDTVLLQRRGLPRLDSLGRGLLNLVGLVQGLGAFALISLGILFTKWDKARPVIRPMIVTHIARSGLLLLPLTAFAAVALGLVIIGQSVSLLSRVGANNYLGTIMVMTVVREIGPLLAALLVLSRTGAANVIELGTARAFGEVEALEVLGIDPIHYFVVPRVIGMAVGIFALTVYMILGALLSGYLWVFLQDVPLTPGDYFRQLAGALSGLDFVLLAAKTLAFGSVLALVTCYHGLAQPLSLGDVSRATVRAVGQSIVFCFMIETLFIVIYLVS